MIQQLQLLIALVTVVLYLGLVTGAAAQLTLMLHVRRPEPLINNLITLECRSNGSQADNPTYHFRRSRMTGSGSLDFEVQLNSNGSVTFELTPQDEGFYFCRANDVDSEVIELVAYPQPIQSVAQVTAHAAQRGEPLTLDCEFEEGKLSSRYSYQWFQLNLQGMLIRLFGTEDVSSIYPVLENHSLVIDPVDFTAEGRYYCIVSVASPTPGTDTADTFFNGIGRNITVDVYDGVDIILGIEDTSLVVKEGVMAEFRCVAEGDPAPTIIWRLNGVEMQNGSDSGRFLIHTSEDMENSIARLSSSFTIMPTVALDNGVVECEASNAISQQTFMVPSTTTLTVLSNNVSEFFITATTSLEQPIVFLHFTLPTKFSEAITITARYTNGEDSEMYEYADDSFRNTLNVSYRIPSDKLPTFETFKTEIAFSAIEVVNGEPREVMGDFTAISEPITVGVNISESECSKLALQFYAACSTTGLIIIIYVVAVLYFNERIKKQKSKSRIRADFSELGGPIRADPSEVEGRIRADFSEVLDIKYTIYIPWQASFEEFGVSAEQWSGAPWQAVQYLLVYQHIETFETESDIKRESITKSTTVNIPWQAVLQEHSLPWQATQVRFEYQYWRIVKTKMVPSLQAMDVERGTEGSNSVSIDLDTPEETISAVIRHHQEPDSQRASGDTHSDMAARGDTVGNTSIVRTPEHQQQILELEIFNENEVLY